MKNNRVKQPKPFGKVKKVRHQNGEIEQIRVEQQQVILKEDVNPKQEREKQRLEEDAPMNQDFEDQFEDVYEEQDAWISQPSQNSQEQEQGQNQAQGTMVSEEVDATKRPQQIQHTFGNKNTKIKIKQKPKKKSGKQSQMQEDQTYTGKPSVFLGNNKALQKGEVLQFDNRAYDMLHRLNIEWPSLSIDFVIPKSPFDTDSVVHQQMKKYPFEVYTVQGSSNNSKENSIYLTKWSKLHRTKYDDDEQNEQEDQSINNDEEAQVLAQQIATTYSVNRIRTLNNAPVVAFWNQNAQIHIMDLVERMNKLENGIGSKKRESCKQIILQSQAEGFGLAWNPKSIGQLVTGNNLGHVQVFTNNQSFTAWQRTSLYHYHKGSVEDIVFSPTEKDVFATCSSDGTLQIVDMKSCDGKKSSLKINAHKQDVNVCDWNKTASHLIVTGSDDSTVKIWDLRMIKNNSKYAEQLLCFKFHNEPITSIKFQPNDESVLAVASEDNRLSIWDMSAENEEFDPQVPNELMFLHQGQQEIKQISYHPIYFEMLISTACDGINIFKPAFEMPEENQDEEDLKREPIRQEDLDKYLGRMSLN